MENDSPVAAPASSHLFRNAVKGSPTALGAPITFWWRVWLQMLIYAVDATLAVMINSSALPSWQRRCMPCPLCRRRDEVGTNGAGPVEPKETAPRTHMSLCWGRCRSYALLEVRHQKGTLENSERSEWILQSNRSEQKAKSQTKPQACQGTVSAWVTTAGALRPQGQSFNKY